MAFGRRMLAGEPVPFGRELGRKCLGEFRVHHLLGQDGEHPDLEDLTLDRHMVVAQGTRGTVASVVAGAVNR